MIYGWIYKDYQGRCWVHRLSDRFSDEDPVAFMATDTWQECVYFDTDVTYEDFERMVGAFETPHTCGELISVRKIDLGMIVRPVETPDRELIVWGEDDMPNRYLVYPVEIDQPQSWDLTSFHRMMLQVWIDGKWLDLYSHEREEWMKNNAH